MLLDLAISSINYKKPISKAIKKPRDRFIKYYQDLYAHVAGTLDESTFMEGSQATYSELGEAVLHDEHQLGRLNHLDLMVAAYWAHEFDPDHASCGAFLSDKFKLNCKMFDVCEQGTIAPLTAINIIHAFMQQDNIKKALLLIMEQTTIPRNKEEGDVIPAETGAISVILEKSPESRHYNVTQANIILDHAMVESAWQIIERIFAEYISKVNAQVKTDLYLRKNSYLWHVFQYYLKKLPSEISIKPFDGQAGCLQPWLALHNVINSQAQAPSNVILLDQDIESLNTGVLVLEAI